MTELYRNPKYIVVYLADEGKVIMATHRLFENEITAYEYAASVHPHSTAIVVEVLKPLYEEEEKQ